MQGTWKECKNNDMSLLMQNKAKKVILLCPEMRVTKKIFTRAAAKKKKNLSISLIFLNYVYS